MHFYHESGVDSGTDVPSKRVPTLGVKEIPEFLEVVIDQKLGGSVVKPWVELMDDGFIPNHTEDSNQTCDRANQKEDSYADGWLPFMD